MDPQNEQDRLEWEDIGLQENPDYEARDFDGIINETEAQSSQGLFKTTTLQPEEELFSKIQQMDVDQRMVVDVILTYIKRIIMSRKSPFKFVAPKLIV